MMKTRITRFSKRSLSMILGVLILITSIGIGSFIRAGAASSTITVYFQDNYNWGTVYAFSGSNMNVRNSSGCGYDVYGGSLNTGWTTMTKVNGTSNIFKATMTVYDGKVAFAKATSNQAGYFNNCNQCAVTPSGMTSGKLLNIWTGNNDEVSYMNSTSYRKYDLQDYTPPVPNITGINGDWTNGDAMTFDSGNDYYYAFTGDDNDKYFRFKFGSTYYEAYSNDFNLETDGTYKPYDGTTSNKKYGARSGNGNAFKLSADADYNYRIYFDASANKVWFTKTARTFTVTLNKNAASATAGTASVTATYNADMPTASVSMPTRTGYDFVGYYDTDAATGGTQYYTAAGASAHVWDKTSNTTLYARWTAKSYTVTLDKNANDATAGTASVTATYDSAMPTAGLTLPTRDGYNFAGYYDTSATTGGTQYYTAAGASAQAWDKASNTTLYARWTLKTYTVTYKAGDNATGSDYTATKTHGTALTLRAATYSRTGYNQTGWSVNSNGSTKDYNISGSYTTNAAITLYPYWELKTYAITLSESGTTGGTLKVDGTVASTATHGSHTFRVDAPAGYEISSISSTGATWTNNESYATSNSVSITGAYTISVTYIKSAKPALRIDYTGAAGTTYTATNGDSVTTSTRHNVTATFTNQSSFDDGTSYSWQYTKGGTVQSSGSGTTSSSGGNITLKSAGKLTSAGTYVFSITVGSKTTSITVVVNTPRALTVSSVSNTTVSGTYTNEFGQTSQTISAAGTYYCKTLTTYSVTYTAAANYCFSDSDNTETTKTYSGTISAAVTTNPTVYEKKYTLTLNKTVAGTTSEVGTYTIKPVTGTDITAPTQNYYTLSNYTVTSGSVTVNGTSYATNSTIPAGDLTAVKATANATIRANFTENSYTLTINQKKGSGTATSKTTQTVKPVTTSTVSSWTVSGYSITGWTVTSGTVYVNGTAYAANSTIRTAGSLSNVTIRAAATIQANFSENTYTVTVESATQDSVALGNVSPASGSAGIDTALSISADAKTGYEFTEWTGSNLTFTSSTSASTTVAASAAGTATANFRRTRLYLDVSDNSTWKGASYYKAYFFQNGSPYNTGTTNGFITMTAVEGVEYMYYVDLPGTFNTLTSSYGFIFIAKSDNNNDWNNKLAQTGDLTFEDQKNKYIISSSSWATDAYFPPVTYNVIVNASEHGKVDGATTVTKAVVDDQADNPTALPTPEADYGYKFTGWKLISGSIIYDGTTYSTANTVFSTSASSSIRANQASTVQAVFDYDDSMNLYIVGRFRVYDTYDGSSRTPTYVGVGSTNNWNTTGTTIPFTYDSTNHYYYVDTYSSLAEVSASVTGGTQYFRVYDPTNAKNWQLSTDQALTESNEGTKYTMVNNTGDKSFYFNDASNTNGPVKICFDPVTNELWFTIPARHTVSVGTISRTVRTTTTQDTNGGTVTVNSSSSATVSEGTNYTISVSPVAGYKLTALAVNGTSIITGYENATSAFTMTHAMGAPANSGDSYSETITATFTAIQYSVTVGSNSSNSGNTVQFKVNSGSAVTSASDVTVADTITPVVTVNTSDGYEIYRIRLTTTSSTSAISGYSNLTNNSAVNMLNQNVRVYVMFRASLPTISASNKDVTAGQPITIGGTTSSWASFTNYLLKTTGGTQLGSESTDGVLTAPTTDIDRTNGTDFKLTLTSTNYKSDLTGGTTYSTRTATKTVTVHVSYSATQLKYLELSDLYTTYSGYGITSDDVSSGWRLYNGDLTAASSALTGLPAWDATNTSDYQTLIDNLNDSYNALVFKTTTIYVLSKYEHSSSSYVNIYMFNNSTTSNDPSPIFYSDTSLTTINSTARNYRMTYEGQTTSGKYLYSFTYRGHQEFIIYRRSDSTSVLSDGSKLTDDVDLRNSTTYPYGEYYIDVKDTDVTSNPSVDSASEFTDFSITATGPGNTIGNEDLVNQCKEGDTGYTVAQIQSKLGITYNGSLVNTSSQTVSQTYAITGPTNRGTSSTVYANSTTNWVPTKPGRYEFSLSASLGTDNRTGAGATFEGTASQTTGDNPATLVLYVAYDEIEVYADMNGNVGTPTIHLTYLDTSNNNAETDLPLEFDMVTGSESIYSRTITLSTLKEKYNLDLIGSGTLTISKISIDSEDVNNSTFTIDTTAARTGTLWLKADSTNMKTFNKIAYGSSTRTFKAVLRTNSGDAAFDNSFADVRGTGIINDALNGSSYEYTVFYAAKDTTANYDFSYNVKAKAEHDITSDDTNYYFDHWENSNGTEVTGIASGADINLLTAPDYDDGDITYTAVYKPVSTNARVEITYNFEDFDTSDGNYEYDASKTTKDETYVKTVKLGEGALSSYLIASSSNASAIASAVAPVIKSNYFDYTYSTATYNTYDSTTNKYKINASFTKSPHSYKVVVKYGTNNASTAVVNGYYQQAATLQASTYGITSGNYYWCIMEGSTERVLAANQNYIARYVTSNDVNNSVQTIYLKSGTASASTTPNSAIMYSYSITYYDDDTQKAQHNFYIIDALTSSSGTLVGGGVIYATATNTTANGGTYRQTAAGTHLADDTSRKAYINDILDGTYDKEYKAQTINNVGFRYLPYEKGTDVFRYSDEMGAYIYTFAGTNTNNSSLGTQTLRVFSYFVYKNGSTYTTVVSSTYAECTRYVS